MRTPKTSTVIPIRFGTAWLGRIHRVGDQCVATRFLIIGLPLLPLESALVRGNTGATLRLQPLSIVVAYLREWGFLAAAVSAAFAILPVGDRPDHHDPTLIA